jgi:ubiquitin-conjugating enzyme E2 D/E
MRATRLRSDIRSLDLDATEGIDAVALDNQLFHWQASILGPAGSPYEGGKFFLYIVIPVSYPMFPPQVRFLTKILHPNVSRHGDVGIDIIQHNWSLALTISKLLLSVQSLLTDPFTQICMEPELGRLYEEDRPKFEALARSWTWKYAMFEVLPPM